MHLNNVLQQRQLV